MIQTQVINFLGGPGAGKSTCAAYLFALLKYQGVNCELVTEYAKDKVWEGSTAVLDHQLYVFAKQYHRIHRLLGKVNYIITDSPTFLSVIYDGTSDEFLRDLVLSKCALIPQTNYVISRQKDYQAMGRLQTEEEAKAIDTKIRNKLHEYHIPWIDQGSSPEAIQQLANTLILRLATDDKN